MVWLMQALDRNRIESLLECKRLGRSLVLLDRTTSTNDEAKQAIRKGARDGHTIVAETQSQGRGQAGRNWDSPKGEDLYLSIVLKLGNELRNITPITLAVGLGVATCAEELSGVTAEVKWPNDVWLDGKKCAGILVEAKTRASELDALVVGIGLNVNRQTLSINSSPDCYLPQHRKNGETFRARIRTSQIALARGTMDRSLC